MINQCGKMMTVKRIEIGCEWREAGSEVGERVRWWFLSGLLIYENDTLEDFKIL